MGVGPQLPAPGMSPLLSRPQWGLQSTAPSVPRRLLTHLHRIVHPKYLKPWTAGGEERVAVPDIETALAADPIMVAEVHAQRSYYNRRQYLVRWEGWSISEATWEDEEGLFGNPKLAAYLNKKARDLTGNIADMSVAEGSAEVKVSAALLR